MENYSDENKYEFVMFGWQRIVGTLYTAAAAVATMAATMAKTLPTRMEFSLTL